MLTQLQLEGPELEPLLARVRSELGPHARIVHAEKIRSGGVAGFFAHERFELTVEVDTSRPRSPSAPAAAEPALPAAPAPPPVAATAVAVRERELAPATCEPAFSAIAGLGEQEPSLFTTLAGLSAPSSSPPEQPVPARTAAAAAHAYAPQAAPAPAAVSVPDQGEDLQSVLAAVLERRPTAAPPPPPRPPVSSTATSLDTAPATFAPYAAFAGVVDGATTPAPAPAVEIPSSVLDLAEHVSADEADAVVSTQSPSFAALLSRLGDDIGALGDDFGAVGHDMAAVADDMSALGDDLPAAIAPAPARAPAASAAPLEPQSADTGAVVVRPPAQVAVPDVPSQEGPAAELARLGLPSHLRPSGVGEQLHTALRASLSRLPTAPPAMNRAGSVLAVVGPLAQALHVAREIAEELGLPAATSVAVATAGTATPDVAERQVLHGVAEAAERRSTWRRRSNLTVVAVDAPLTASGAAEARAFLAALSPTATWGVVEATRKAQDVGSWARALGGVHALALTELEETSDPAAVLELGIPVSRLGGRPATPRAWATLLTGRLAA